MHRNQPHMAATNYVLTQMGHTFHCIIEAKLPSLPLRVLYDTAYLTLYLYCRQVKQTVLCVYPLFL